MTPLYGHVPTVSKERLNEIKAYAKHVAREQLFRDICNVDDFKYTPPHPQLELTDEEVREVISGAIDQATLREGDRDMAATYVEDRIQTDFGNNPWADPRNLNYRYIPDYTGTDADMDPAFD